MTTFLRWSTRAGISWLVFTRRSVASCAKNWSKWPMKRRVCTSLHSHAIVFSAFNVSNGELMAERAPSTIMRQGININATMSFLSETTVPFLPSLRFVLPVKAKFEVAFEVCRNDRVIYGWSSFNDHFHGSQVKLIISIWCKKWFRLEVIQAKIQPSFCQLLSFRRITSNCSLIIIDVRLQEKVRTWWRIFLMKSDLSHRDQWQIVDKSIQQM